MRRLALVAVAGLAAAVLWTGAAQAAETVVVVDPPASGIGAGRGVALEQADDPTPVGFIAGYLGITLLALTVAVMVRDGRGAPPRTSGPGSGIAYGRRAAGDFWADPEPVGAGHRRRSVPG